MVKQLSSCCDKSSACSVHTTCLRVLLCACSALPSSASSAQSSCSMCSQHVLSISHQVRPGFWLLALSTTLTQPCGTASFIALCCYCQSKGLKDEVLKPTVLVGAGDDDTAARGGSGSHYPAGPPLPLLGPLLPLTNSPSWPSHLPDVGTQ